MQRQTTWLWILGGSIVATSCALPEFRLGLGERQAGVASGGAAADEGQAGEAGGSEAAGGTPSGGLASTGSASGGTGQATGGAARGGVGTGGVRTGGTRAAGGQPAGGASRGGASTGGSRSGGATAMGGTAAGGIPTSSGGTHSGGTTTTGGTTTGGTTAAGGTGMGGSLPTGGTDAGLDASAGLATPDQYLTSGTLKGYVWTATDQGGSSIVLAQGTMCVQGTVVQVPIVDGSPNYSLVWGTVLGWNLNEGMYDGGSQPENPADLSQSSSLVLGLSNADGLSLRVQLMVKDSDGGEQAYCTDVAASGGTVDLADMKTNCWDTLNNVSFDPSTMQPTSVQIAVVPSTLQAYPFDFCVTALSIR